MLVTQHKTSIFFNERLRFSNSKRNRNPHITITSMAKKRNFQESPTNRKQPIFRLQLPNKIIGGSVITVFGFGFIDAGYSGDWSRIGAISRETESLIKVAAFLVVPLCAFLVFSLFKESKT